MEIDLVATSNPNEFTKTPGQVIMKLGVLNTVLMAAKITEKKNAFCAVRTPCRNEFSSIPQRGF